MISQIARFANDCYHILKAPAGSKTAIIKDLVLPLGGRVGFEVTHFDRNTLNYLYREIFVRQHYYFRSESKASTILDCGANVGMASLYFKWLYPQCRIQAFEPDPTTFGLLQKNIARNKLDVSLHNCALWDEETEIDFFVDANHPGALVMSADPTFVKGEPIKVPTHRLSTYIDRDVDFLKLDVEGAEHRVLNDLVRTGKIKLIRQMVVEYHHRMGHERSCLADFLSKLEEAGFEYQIHAPRYPVTSTDVFQAMLIAATNEAQDRHTVTG